MKIFFLLPLALLLQPSWAAPKPKGVAEVTMSAEKAEYGKDDKVKLTLITKNKGKKPVFILKYLIPSVDPEEDTIQAPIFSVKRDGDSVNYIGKDAKRQGPTGKDYMKLKSGEAIKRNIDDICEFYDCSSTGTYEFTYSVENPEPPQKGGKKRETIISNTLRLKVTGRAKKPRRDPEPVQISGTSDPPLYVKTKKRKGRQEPTCSGTRQSQLVTAFNEAIIATQESMEHLQSWVPKAVASPEIWAEHDRYKTWFGAHNTAREDRVMLNFEDLYLHFTDPNTEHKIVFDCSCKDSSYAYVYTNRPYEITLCKAFWQAPLTGRDSKMGTLIHEMSHFNIVTGTDDHAYGHSNCQSLADSDPEEAIDNADSHEYFAENSIPGLKRQLRGS